MTLHPAIILAWRTELRTVFCTVSVAVALSTLALVAFTGA